MILAELMKTIDALDPGNAADSSGAVGGSQGGVGVDGTAAAGANNNSSGGGGYSAANLGRLVVAAPWLQEGMPPPSPPRW